MTYKISREYSTNDNNIMNLIGEVDDTYRYINFKLSLILNYNIKIYYLKTYIFFYFSNLNLHLAGQLKQSQCDFSI